MTRGDGQRSSRFPPNKPNHAAGSCFGRIGHVRAHGRHPRDRAAKVGRCQVDAGGARVALGPPVLRVGSTALRTRRDGGTHPYPLRLAPMGHLPEGHLGTATLPKPGFLSQCPVCVSREPIRKRWLRLCSGRFGEGPFKSTAVSSDGKAIYCAASSDVCSISAEAWARRICAGDQAASAPRFPTLFVDAVREHRGRRSMQELRGAVRRVPYSQTACGALQPCRVGTHADAYNLPYSALACLRIGMSGSAPFQSVRKSW